MLVLKRKQPEHDTFTSPGLRQRSCGRVPMFSCDDSGIQVVLKTADFSSFSMWLLISIYIMLLQKSLALIVSAHLLKT